DHHPAVLGVDHVRITALVIKIGSQEPFTQIRGLGYKFARMLDSDELRGAAAEPPDFAFDCFSRNHFLLACERLRCRIRYFTDGLILGRQSFLESHFYNLKLKLGYQRRRPATRLIRSLRSSRQ